jgi:hypothetical protein
MLQRSPTPHAFALALAIAGCASVPEESGSGLSAGNLTNSATDTDDLTEGGTTTAAGTSGTGTGTSAGSTSGATSTGPTTETEGGCIDNDGDGYGEGCALGPDCNDNDFNNYTEAACQDCKDGDADDVWAGCDQYDENKQGPDCDDDNDAVGLDDSVELCNGLAENCAGEIDPLPADQMCPTSGDPPNVGGWSCEPPMAGVDGCKIASCAAQFYDINGELGDGCECAGTLRSKSLDECGDGAAGLIATLAEGATAMDVAVGVIPLIDNGVGAGAEDWYTIEFPEQMAVGKRPFAGIIQVTFAKNDGDDYRFEVYRACGTQAFSQGIATAFGAGAPPAKEWWFIDTPQDPNSAKYSNTVAWPNKVYVRVFRTKSDKTCNSYQLSVKRVAN